MSTEHNPDDYDQMREMRIVSLRDLLQSPGWALVQHQARVEWGPEGYGRQMQAAIANASTGPDRPYEIAQIAERVDATARAINALVEWPKEELARLTAKKVSTPFAALRRTAR